MYHRTTLSNVCTPKNRKGRKTRRDTTRTGGWQQQTNLTRAVQPVLRDGDTQDSRISRGTLKDNLRKLNRPHAVKEPYLGVRPEPLQQPLRGQVFRLGDVSVQGVHLPGNGVQLRSQLLDNRSYARKLTQTHEKSAHAHLSHNFYYCIECLK